MAGEPDPALVSLLACLAELEPTDDTDLTIREVLTWTLAGAELAKAKCLTEPQPHPKAAEPKADEPKADEPNAAVLPSSRRGQLYLELARHGPIRSANLVWAC